MGRGTEKGEEGEREREREGEREREEGGKERKWGRRKS